MMIAKQKSMLGSCYTFALLLMLFAFFKAYAQPQPVVVEGFPLLLETGPFFKSSEGPTLADLDRDGRLDIIVASGKKVYAIRADGTALEGWPQSTTYTTHNSAAVGDLDHDGKFEVITFDRYGLPPQSFLYAWNHRGVLLPGFSVAPGLANYAIVLYDLDQDGDLEIIGSFGGKVYVFHHDGSVAQGWPQVIEPFSPKSKAAVGDLNNDGQPEIVVAAQHKVPYNDPNVQGRLYVWRANGELLEGWPVSTPKRYEFTGWCNPALVDVDANGTMEIAVGAYSFVRPNQYSFAALYRHDGTMMPGWPQYTAGADSLDSFSAGPAVADLDADSQPDLIFGDFWDNVIAWKGDGTLIPGWPVTYGQIDSSLVFRSLQVANPSVGDIDGDGSLDSSFAYFHTAYLNFASNLRLLS